MLPLAPGSRAIHLIRVGLWASIGILCVGAGLIVWGGDEAVVAEPGISFLDLIRHVRVEEVPETNLPPEIAPLTREPFRMRTPEFEPWQWVWGGVVPAEYGRRLEDFPDVRFWHFVPSLASRSEEGPPRILRQQAELVPWDPEGSNFPGQAVWWDEKARCLRALSAKEPEGIRIEYLADPRREFGELERGRSLPDAKALVGRFEIGNAVHRGLLVAAPGVVSLRIDEVRAESLSFVVGVLPRGYRAVGEFVEETPSGSDGVDFAVEIVGESGAERAFELSLPRGKVGSKFQEGRVDLHRYRGRPVEIRLITSPGAGGDRWFDYAVWGRLRFVGEPSRPPDRPSVVLVDLDTLRPDRLGGYGHGRPTTPRLDAWAAQRATVYLDALATSSWTLPSTSSMRTGLAVHQHGAVQYPVALPLEAKGIAAYLSERGYWTRGVAEGPYLGSRFGFDRGFDEYDWSRYGRSPDWTSLPAELREQAGGRPFYFFLHTYFVHAPYPVDDRFEDPENPYRGWLVGREIDYGGVIGPFLEGKLDLDEADRAYVSRRYDAGVAQLDGAIGPFLEALEETFADRELLVFVTSDHGEEFFEHGQMSHSHSLYGELLRVPLVVRFPEGGGRARVGRSTEQVSHLDLVPTVLDFAGVPIPDHLPGRSLRRPVSSGRVRVASTAAQRAIQVGGLKLILGATTSPRWNGEAEELYDLRSDPLELDNLAARRPEDVRRLREILERFESAYPPVGEGAIGAVSESDLEALRNLGYLGGPQ